MASAGQPDRARQSCSSGVDPEANHASDPHPVDETGSGEPQAAELLVYRDAHLLALNKPAGLAVHRGWARDRVVALTVARKLAGQRVYPVHRLDRPASGVLLFALDPQIAARVQAQWQSEQVDKRYLALVRGVPPSSLVLDHPVPRSPGGERVPAVTEIRCLASSGRFALVEARPRTGRLHQIRRHLKHLSCPLVGDVRYGKGEINRLFRERYGLHRLALHALELELDHPQSGRRLRIGAPLSPDFAHTLRGLGMPVPEPTDRAARTSLD